MSTTSDAPTFGNVHDGMPYSDNTMQHAEDEFEGTAFVPGGEPLPDDDGNPYEEFLASDGPDIDASLLDDRKRSPKARQYERKAKGVFATAVKVTVAHPPTVADSAALLLHGPNIAEKIGDLAAENAKFARMVDMITDQTENAATALIVATLPLVLQVVRNHEPVVENTKPVRTWKIPFTKRQLRFKLGFKLGKRMHNMTNDPDALKAHVFSNKQVQEALEKQGIHVVSG